MQFEQLGPYRIGKQLGRGGMGSVYEGVDVETGEPAAIKVLSIRLAGEEGFRERFDVEIETLKKLKHPNIVRLYGYGEQDGYPFYAMELVPGMSLEEAVRKGRRFDWREATQIGIKMCRALKHAHDHGVIHRDIKPANILLAEDGEVKLSDFGIAKFFGTTGLTSTGGVVGTAEYMAPEQADSRPVTHQSDLYSLGGVLYTLLARRPPFVARNVVEMLHKQRSLIPDPVRQHAPEVPEELEAIIAQLLEKDPERRIRNAMIMARRLEAMEHGLARREAKGESRLPSSNDQTMIVRGTGVEPGPHDPNEITRDGTGFSLGPASSGAVDRDNLGATMGTGAEAAEPSLPLVPIEEQAKAPPPASRFTTVQEDEARAAAEEPRGPLVSPQTWVLAGSLAAVGLFTYYLLAVPPNADRLFRRVAAVDGKIDSLIEVEDDIDKFLRYHPNDPRSRDMEDYRQRIELYRREKRLQRKAKNQGGDLLPAEQAYVEAMEFARTDPQRAMVRLQALIDLYKEGRRTPEATQHTLDLAEEQLARLQDRSSNVSSAEQEFLERRLDAADKLARQDPSAAAKVWRAVIELYGDRSGAQALVKRARAGLALHPVKADSGKGEETSEEAGPQQIGPERAGPEQAHPGKTGPGETPVVGAAPGAPSS